MNKNRLIENINKLIDEEIGPCEGRDLILLFDQAPPKGAGLLSTASPKETIGLLRLTAKNIEEGEFKFMKEKK